MSDSLLTCMTCRVGFHDGDLQRQHYKSDWHRYNLKRKIVDLPPVTAESFAEKISAQEASQVDSTKDTSQYCTVCKKSFGNDKAFHSHMVSKKHLQAVKELSSTDTPAAEEEKAEENAVKIKIPGKKFPPPPEPMKQKPSVVPQNQMEVDDDDDEEDEWEEVEGDPIPITLCLFCDHESEDIEQNIEHMSKSHSFFIPDMEYCTDLEGLIEYLGEKVGEGMMCLWCNEKGRHFYTVDAVQRHMRDKGHCKMIHDGEAVFEYTDYYDYSTSYPEGCDDVNPDEVYQQDSLEFNDNMQLVLPSGKVLGHRALQIYYKQYIRPTTHLVERKNAKRNKILSQYRGYHQMTANEAQQKCRDQKYFKHVRDKYRVKLGVKGNKTLQHHFRDQVKF